jgi:hypothetical protein
MAHFFSRNGRARQERRRGSCPAAAVLAGRAVSGDWLWRRRGGVEVGEGGAAAEGATARVALAAGDAGLLLICCMRYM